MVKFNNSGLSALSEVSNIKLSLFVLNTSNDDQSDKDKPRYSDELEEACKKLVSSFSELEKISGKLEMISLKLHNLSSLDVSNSDDSDVSKCEDAVFRTWRISQFADNAAEISNMYKKELLCKRCIVENAAHVDLIKDEDDVTLLSEKCRDILTTYSSCWLHQPFINECIEILHLEGMLFESGHIS
ncbi:unnamed protein product [Clavelina lepadiformis]|uniref:Uncharacterized protein n=1 Tax=Clavelina lepadiformis TaxID=159417 RepID=A0ABP0EXY6_CLALP